MKTEELKKITIFKGLDESGLKAVAAVCWEHDFKIGDMIFDKGQDSDSLFIMLKGEADVMIEPPGLDEALKVQTVQHGDLLGDVSFLDRAPRSASVLCVKNSKVAKINNQDLHTLINENPHFGVVILQNIGALVAQRLRKSDKALTKYFNENKGVLLKDSIHTFYSRLRG